MIKQPGNVNASALNRGLGSSLSGSCVAFPVSDLTLLLRELKPGTWSSLATRVLAGRSILQEDLASPQTQRDPCWPCVFVWHQK